MFDTDGKSTGCANHVDFDLAKNLRSAAAAQEAHKLWFYAEEKRLNEIAQRKRDRFELAKAAMQGLVSSDTGIASLMADDKEAEAMMFMAVTLADLMLAELDKEVGQ